MEKVLNFLHTLFLNVILECDKTIFYCRIIFGMDEIRMGRKNFFERIEQNLDLQNEYKKLEKIVFTYTNCSKRSLNDEIESHFDSRKYKKNYLSFDELRSHLGFTYTKAWDYSFDAKIESIDDFFVNREMILNMILVVLPEEAQIETVL